MARKKKEATADDVEKKWKEFWVPIVMKKGKIDLEQLKKELFDFSELIDKHCDFICYATGEKLSKPTYTLQSLKSAFDDHVEKLIEDAIEDYKKHNAVDSNLDEESEEEEVDHEDVVDRLGRQSFDDDINDYDQDY